MDEFQLLKFKISSQLPTCEPFRRKFSNFKTNPYRLDVLVVGRVRSRDLAEPDGQIHALLGFKGLGDGRLEGHVLLGQLPELVRMKCRLNECKNCVNDSIIQHCMIVLNNCNDRVLKCDCAMY
jgi:hypothetical protein